MKNTFLFFIILLCIIGIVLFAAMQENVTLHKKHTELQIAASFYPLSFLASEITGDKAIVTNITPSGVEPHDYEPSTKDMAKIENSDVIILNGLLEAWGNKLKNNSQDTNVSLVIAGEDLFSRKNDPHIWLDPLRYKLEAQAITNAVIKIDPSHTKYYRDNQKVLDMKLNKLDSDYKNSLSNCQQKNFITSHAAFGYLADRYQLQQVTIAGLSPDAEPSVRQLADITKFAKEHNVKYIFFESLVSPKLSQTIADEIGAKTLVLDPIEGVSDDERNAGKNYFTIMYENLKNLQIALECKI
jgi:zinc transport system substrate-binding protein